VALPRVLKFWADTPHWKEKGTKKDDKSYKVHGVGISGIASPGGARQMGHQSCGAILRLCEDGTVNYLTGATDCGQGSDTLLVQIIAEELGLKMEDIDIKRVDTAFTPCDAGSYGSRVTPMAGEAAQKAAINLRNQLATFAAERWEANPEDIVFKNRQVSVKGSPDKSMPFEKLSKIACYSRSGAVIVSSGCSEISPGIYDFEKGRGNPGTSVSFISHLAEVDVDVETGFVRCTNMTLAEDCGRPLIRLMWRPRMKVLLFRVWGRPFTKGS